MLTGVTSSGFNYEITDDQLNNMELIDALTEFDDTESNGDKAIIISKVCRLMLASRRRLCMIMYVNRKETFRLRRFSPK